jgi:asparagine synthase (glutamine-hydrolysing)
LSANVAAQLNGHDVSRSIRTAYATAPPSDALAGMLAADIAVRLPDDYLVKVDRASMAVGLEVRPPLLDHELLELTARMPASLKVRGQETKWLFKEIYRQRLPTSVTSRPKQGFEIPLDDWMRGPLRPMFEDMVLDPRQPVAGLINQEAAARVYRSHVSSMGRHGSVLWNLLVLARWTAHYGPSF